MATCLIAAGGNLGDRVANLHTALERIAKMHGIYDFSASEFLETAPVGGPADQPTFLNGAARFECQLAPLELAKRLHEIESQLGRKREVRWDARTVDLDLLLYDDLSCQTHELQLPHPRMTFRKFVLHPAAEIAPEMRNPASGWTLQQHLQHLQDSSKLLALAGGTPDLRRCIAKEVAAKLDGKFIEQQASDPTGGNPEQWSIENFWQAETAVTAGQNDPKSQPIEVGPRPRVLIVLEEACGDNSVSSSKTTARTWPITDTLSHALARFPGGGILRTRADQPLAETVAEITAAAQASE